MEVGVLEPRWNGVRVHGPRGIEPASRGCGGMLAALPVGGGDEDVVPVDPVEAYAAVVPHEIRGDVVEEHGSARLAFERDTVVADNQRLLAFLGGRPVAGALDRLSFDRVGLEASPELRRAARSGNEQALESPRDGSRDGAWRERL